MKALNRAMSPLGNGLGIVITAAAGLAPFCQPLLHHICWAVKEQHLQASTTSILDLLQQNA